MKLKEVTEEITVSEFRNTGLLWFANTILHAFGIVLIAKDDKLVPARSKFRGYPVESNTKGYQKVAKYMQENCNDILEEAEEG